MAWAAHSPTWRRTLLVTWARQLSGKPQFLSHDLEGIGVIGDQYLCTYQLHYLTQPGQDGFRALFFQDIYCQLYAAEAIYHHTYYQALTIALYSG